MREATTIRNFAHAGKLAICAAFVAASAAVSGAAYEGTCAGRRFTVSDGEVWRDNESVGRSGHMGHALVDCGNGRILDFASNCAGMERVSGHSGYGWMEYRISDDYGKTFGPVRVLPCSKKMYEEGRHTALCEKAVRAPDGRIVLFFQITDTSRPICCEPWFEPLMAVSSDNGETFSAFMPTGADAGRIYDAVCDDKYIYFIMLANPNFLGSKPEHVYKVYRAGADLKFTPSVLPIDAQGRGYGALEFAADGALHAYAYNSKCETEMDYTVSRDRGVTWSSPGKSRAALKIRNPQIRRLDDVWFLIGRNGGFGKGDALAFYSSPDGINWDAGVKLDVRPDGTGTGYYGCMLPIHEPGKPPRMLMQYSRPYRGSCVNVMHRTITLGAAANRGKGALCLTFDDRNFKDWERCLPLFEKYGAHATFFVYGAIDEQAVSVMKRLSAAGHSVGLHGLKHQRAPKRVAAIGAEGYLREEIFPQLSACRENGINVRSFAYPMSDRTPETDALLLRHFDRLRTGTGGKGNFDGPFPMSAAAGRGLLLGLCSTSPDDAPEKIVSMMPEVAAKNGVLVAYAHGIERAGTKHDVHNIREADLERILAAAKSAGVAVVGFDELPCKPKPKPAPAACAAHLDWRGKKVAIFGDSISDAKLKGWRHWWRYLADLTGIEPLVYAQNGTQWRSVPRQADALLADGEDPDAILIFMGTNDFNSSIPLGEWWKVVDEAVNRNGKMVVCHKRVMDYSPNTVRGRINSAMKLLKERYPDRQIVLLTPIHRGFFTCGETNVQPDEAYSNAAGLWIDDYVACVREAGPIWSSPVIDLYSESGLMPSLAPYGRFFNRADTDLLHPNSEGCRRIGTVVAARLAAIPATFR